MCPLNKATLTLTFNASGTYTLGVTPEPGMVLTVK